MGQMREKMAMGSKAPAASQSGQGAFTNIRESRHRAKKNAGIGGITGCFIVF
jgi:hypothetical protein